MITINQAAIESFFERRAIAGASIPGADSSVERMANRMLRKAKANASGSTPSAGVVRKRTGDLAESLKKIIRTDPRTGSVEIGVGSTIEYSKWVEDGSPAHQIVARNFRLKSGPMKGTPVLWSAPGHPDPLVGIYGPGRFSPIRQVNHPGNDAKKFLRKAVDDVAFRGL